MNFNKIYALGLRHIYLISNSLPRIIDLIYWPMEQIKQNIQIENREIG